MEALTATLLNPSYVLGLFITMALGVFAHWEARGREEWTRDEPVSVESPDVAPYRGAGDHAVYRRTMPNPRAPWALRLVAAVSVVTAATLITLGAWISWLAACIYTAPHQVVSCLLVTSFMFGFPGFRFAHWSRRLLHARPSALRKFGAWKGLFAPLVALPLGVFFCVVGAPALAGPALLVAAMLPLLLLVFRRRAQRHIVDLWTGRGYEPKCLADMEPPMRRCSHTESGHRPFGLLRGTRSSR